MFKIENIKDKATEHSKNLKDQISARGNKIQDIKKELVGDDDVDDDDICVDHNKGKGSEFVTGAKTHVSFFHGMTPELISALARPDLLHKCKDYIAKLNIKDKQNDLKELRLTGMATALSTLVTASTHLFDQIVAFGEIPAADRQGSTFFVVVAIILSIMIIIGSTIASFKIYRIMTQES